MSRPFDSVTRAGTLATVALVIAACGDIPPPVPQGASGQQPGQALLWQLRMVVDDCEGGTCQEDFQVSSTGSYSAEFAQSDGSISGNEASTLDASMQPIRDAEQIPAVSCTSAGPQPSLGRRELSVMLNPTAPGQGTSQVLYRTQPDGSVCFPPGLRAEAQAVFDQVNALTETYGE